MEFKVGQVVEITNNDGMAAEKGATAIVIGIGLYGISVEWLIKSKGQMDGYYMTSHCNFRPLVRRGEQLEFAFMQTNS